MGPMTYWTIYSATTILEKCRKVVLEKWFCKLGFFFWLETQKKNPKFADPLFSKIRVCRTTFLPPSKSLLRVQIKRLKWVRLGW